MVARKHMKDPDILTADLSDDEEVRVRLRGKRPDQIDSMLRLFGPPSRPWKTHEHPGTRRVLKRLMRRLMRRLGKQYADDAPTKKLTRGYEW